MRARLAVPNELDDGRNDTAWRADGPVDGQFFTFTPRGSAKARQLRVLGGDHGAKGKLDTANRPHELAIVTEHDAWRVDLPDAAQRGARRGVRHRSAGAGQRAASAW